MDISFEKLFDLASTGRPFRIFPAIHRDSRGSFAEQWSSREAWPDEAGFLADYSWAKQINRSVSKAGAVRGMHAQRGSFCQGKLVEAVAGQVYDVVVDARPDSETFSVAAAYLLDSEEQTKLWVPRGFLHGFVVPLDCEKAVFQYAVDAPYSKESETGCSPVELLDGLSKIEGSGLDGAFLEAIQAMVVDPRKAMSEKDMAAEPFTEFMRKLKEASSRWWE